MKNYLIIVIALFLTGNIFSQEKVEVPVNDKKLPDIIFEKTVHDYGTIEKGGNGVCEFKFKNTGKTPLVLQSVKTSCGCTTPEWPKEPILKGKTGTIKVKYDTNRLGKFSKTITIVSNAKTPSVELRIEGKVETSGTSSADEIQERKKTEPVKIKSEPK